MNKRDPVQYGHTGDRKPSQTKDSKQPGTVERALESAVRPWEMERTHALLRASISPLVK